MRIQRWRVSLWITGAGFYAAAVAALAWAVVWPCTDSTSPLVVARPPQANGDASVSHEQALDPQQLAVLAKKPLRVPFSSSTPPPAEETDPVPMDPDPMLNVTLRGTILERGYSVAVFETPESPVELRGVGELVGDEGDEAEVVEIYRDHVVLRYQGQLVTLPFPAGDGL